MSNLSSRILAKSAVPTGVVSLYSNRIIQQIAAGLLGVFLPVFFFKAFNESINLLLIYYIAAYSLWLLTVVPGVIIASKISFRKGLILSVFAGALFYLCLYAFDRNVLALSILSIIFATTDRVFYWVPYHSGFAKFTNKKNRGKIIGIFSSIFSLFAATLPFIAGFVIASFGFEVLFVFAIFIYLSSLFPFAMMPRINEKYSFSFWQTWKVLLHKRDRKILYTYMADGAQGVVGTVIWPLFIFIVMDGDFKAVGLVSSLVVLATIIVQLIAGSYTDKFNKKTMMKYGSVLYALGWVVKVFVNTGFQVFVTSSYHNFSKIVMRTPFDALMYEKAADAGHYMDEYTVLRSMALNIGRILMLVALIILFNFAGLQAAFVLAAIVALFVNLI